MASAESAYSLPAAQKAVAFMSSGMVSNRGYTPSSHRKSKSERASVLTLGRLSQIMQIDCRFLRHQQSAESAVVSSSNGSTAYGIPYGRLRMKMVLSS
ncbi:MAG: hypothetical protein ACLR4Z_03700 [Butyricicoccaceae bacterium]